MHSLKLKSPAKINLCLYVLGRRPDGYHRLWTLFHRLSLTDQMTLRKSKQDIRLRCSDRSLSTGEDNLIVRAYRLLQRRFPGLRGVSVDLLKRIPIGGGLGGGSSNAAFFLLGMKKLYGLKIGLAGLVRLGRKLGADVPFFLYDVNQAVGRGRGDRIAPLPAKHHLNFLLVIDNKGLTTKSVYQNLPRRFRQAFLTKKSRAVRIPRAFLDGKDLIQAGRFLHNDLESSAFRLQPSIRTKIEWMNQLGISAARMSGSGPTVFGIVQSRERAEKFSRKLRRQFPGKRTVVCSTY